MHGRSASGTAWALRADDVWLARTFDAGTLDRAVPYTRAGVQRITLGDGGRVVLAEVQGTRPRPYQVLITVSSTPEDELDLTMRCSCPVARECKHIAAVLLHLRAELEGEEPAPPDWRALLDSLAGCNEHEAGRAEQQTLVPLPDLVVIVQVDRLPARHGPGTTTVVRLLGSRMGRTGRPVPNLSWGDVAWGADRDAWSGGPASAMVRREHAVLAEEILALDRARHRYRSSDPDAIDLAALGPAGWDWVRRALAAGVTVQAPPGQRDVVLDPVPVSLDADVTQTPGGGLGLTVRLEGFDGVIASDIDLVGDPGSLVVVTTVQGHEVRPLESGPELLALVGAPEVRIPPEEVDDFVTRYLPVLHRHARVGSHLAAAPPVAAPWTRLVARVSAPEPARLDVEWGFEEVRPPALGRGDERVTPFVPMPVVPRPAQRDRLAATEALTRLPGAGSGRPVRLEPRSVFTGADAVTFGELVLPLLEDDPGARVERRGTIPDYREAEDDAIVHVSVDETEGTDWFDLSVTISIDGEDVPLAPLLDALSRQEPLLLLPSGTWFRLDRPELLRLRELIEEAEDLRDPDTGSVRVSRYHVGYVDDLAELGVVERQSTAWARQVERLRSVELDPAPDVPAQMEATMRPYQLDGYQWLSALWDTGLGGVLADDMGLGKTLQVLATLARAQERDDLDGPVLVIAPASVVGTWLSEAARFAPGLRAVARARTSATSRTPLTDEVGQADLVVTTYAVARIDAEHFAAHRWRALVLDEAHTVKNHQSQTYRAIRRLPRAVTFAVTGTPVENSLMDLWSLLSLVAPGLLPRADRFSQQWRRPIERGDESRLAVLRRRVGPLMLRRTKDEVALDLPPKTVQLLEVVLAPAHRRLYDRHLQRERQRMLGLLRDPDANRVAILASLTRLRQLALDPRLIAGADTPARAEGTGATQHDSAKIDVLVAHLHELAREGHRALVFSQFTSFLALVRARLEREGLSYAYLDGATTRRQEVVDGFRGGDAPVFLISLKAGGTGLTLTEADYVFVLDPWWNPAAEAQAVDRAHRIGQDKPVVVYRLVSAGTIEEKVIALQDRKRDLVARVVDDPLTGGIGSDDLVALLEPDARE